MPASLSSTRSCVYICATSMAGSYTMASSCCSRSESMIAIAPACTDIVTCALRVLTSSAMVACRPTVPNRKSSASPSGMSRTAKAISGFWTTCFRIAVFELMVPFSPPTKIRSAGISRYSSLFPVRLRPNTGMASPRPPMVRFSRILISPSSGASVASNCVSY